MLIFLLNNLESPACIFCTQIEEILGRTFTWTATALDQARTLGVQQLLLLPCQIFDLLKFNIVFSVLSSNLINASIKFVMNLRVMFCILCHHVAIFVKLDISI